MSGTHGAPWGGKSRESTSQGAAQIVGGITVTAGKSGTAQLQNLLDVGSRHAAPQQSACDPQVHDAPVWLWESLCNVPAPHPGLVDLGGAWGRQARWSHPLPGRGGDGRRIAVRRVTASSGLLASDLQEAFGLARQTSC